MKKRVVYLLTDFGEGHKSAVKALQEGLDKYYPNKFEHIEIDVGALLGSSLDKFIEIVYKNSIRYAKLPYKAYFELSDRPKLTSSENNFYPLLKKYLQPIADADPDIVISCYPLLSYSVSKFLDEINPNVPFISLITDTGEVHSNWVCKEIDYFLVPTFDTGFYLKERGIEEGKIKAFGFPVKQLFYRKYNPKKIKQGLGIGNKKVILYFGGALGSGRIKSKLKAIDSKIKGCAILVICGKNKRLLKNLQKEVFSNQVIPLGFVDNVAEILSVADLVVSKAGGISTMEIITMKKPMVVTEVVLGQEEPNARFVEMMGFGYIEKEPEELAKRVHYVLETGDLKRLQHNLNLYNLNEKSDKNISAFINSLVG